MVEVTAHIKRDYPYFRELIVGLAKVNIIVDFNKTECRFRLQQEGDGLTFVIPEPLIGIGDGLILSLTCAEGFKKDDDVKRAIVVCGPEGQMLKPYYRARKPNGLTARFSVPSAFVEVGFQNDLVVITQHELQVMLNDGSATVIADKAWEGRPEELPEALESFYPAVLAAVAKGHCPDCQHIHFGNTGAD